LSFEPEITSIPVGDTYTIEREVPETLLPKVIESDLLESKNLFPEVIEPKEPQPSSPDSLGPSSSLPLSKAEPIYLGHDSEPLPYGLLSIEEIPQEEPRPSTLVHWEGLFLIKPILFRLLNLIHNLLYLILWAYPLISHSNLHWDY